MSVSGEQQEVINDEQEVINNEQEIINVEPVGEGEGSGGVVSDPLAAAGESPVDGDEQGAGQEELKGEEEKKAESTQEGAVGGTQKFGRFRTSKADEGESCSVHQHCTRRGVKGFSPGAAVDLLMGTEGVAAMRPETIPSFFRGALKKNAGGVALKVKREGEWRNYTFQQYWDTVVSVAKSYLKVRRVHRHTDTQTHDDMGIHTYILPTPPRWVWSRSMACVSLGSTPQSGSAAAWEPYSQGEPTATTQNTQLHGEYLIPKSLSSTHSFTPSTRPPTSPLSTYHKVRFFLQESMFANFVDRLEFP